MSHDEIVGSVLSWLGNWREHWEQPKAAVLVTKSTCSFLGWQEVLRGDPQVGHGSVLWDMLWKTVYAEIVVRSSLPSPEGASRGDFERTHVRTHVAKRVTDEAECWQGRQRTSETKQCRRVPGGDEFWAICYYQIPRKGSKRFASPLQIVLLKYLASIYLEKGPKTAWGEKAEKVPALNRLRCCPDTCS